MSNWIDPRTCTFGLTYLLTAAHVAASPATIRTNMKLSRLRFVRVGGGGGMAAAARSSSALGGSPPRDGVDRTGRGARGGGSVVDGDMTNPGRYSPVGL